jgi:hypothetical protein
MDFQHRPPLATISSQFCPSEIVNSTPIWFSLEASLLVSIHRGHPVWGLTPQVPDSKQWCHPWEATSCLSAWEILDISRNLRLHYNISYCLSNVNEVHTIPHYFFMTTPLILSLIAVVPSLREFTTMIRYDQPIKSEEYWLLVRHPVSLYVFTSNNRTGGSVVVEALCYKPEGRWFESRWGHWIFQFT